jgi:hypothetical protein
VRTSDPERLYIIHRSHLLAYGCISLAGATGRSTATTLSRHFRYDPVDNDKMNKNAIEEDDELLYLT